MDTISVRAVLPEELQQTLQMILDKQERIEERLNEMCSEQEARREAETKPMTMREAAEMLHLSVDRVKHLCNSHAIPYYKHGRRIFFKREELAAVMTKRRNPTEAELNGNPVKYGRQLLNA